MLVEQTTFKTFSSSSKDIFIFNWESFYKERRGDGEMCSISWFTPLMVILAGTGLSTWQHEPWWVASFHPLLLLCYYFYLLIHILLLLGIVQAWFDLLFQLLKILYVVSSSSTPALLPSLLLFLPHFLLLPMLLLPSPLSSSSSIKNYFWLSPLECQLCDICPL